MGSELRELWRFRELLITMVQRELRVRYKNSVLGFLWSFVNPLVTTAVMTIVFGKLLNNGVNNYSAYVLAAYLPFMFFQFSLLDSAQSILSAQPLIKKIYFPREILPLAAVISNFIHLLSGFAVFFLFLLVIYLRRPEVVPFQASTVWLPALLLISLAFSTGLSLLVSALNTFYEDVKYLVGVAMYLLFFLCPVMYFVEQVANSPAIQGRPELWRLYYLNPIAVLCTAYRQILLAPQPIRLTDGRIAQPYPLQPEWIAYCATLSVVTLVVGYAVFNRMKWRFMERP